MVRGWLLILLLAGCSNLPDTVAECGDLYVVKEEIEKCEAAVISKEDNAHRRREAIKEREACKLPNVWMARGRWSGDCRAVWIN